MIKLLWNCIKSASKISSHERSTAQLVRAAAKLAPVECQKHHALRVVDPFKISSEGVVSAAPQDKVPELYMGFKMYKSCPRLINIGLLKLKMDL